MNISGSPHKFLKNASDIWKFIEKHGGLDTNRYDSDLVEELKARLLVPKKVDLEEFLRNVSTEDFIIAFFQAVQPYVEMMSDLLSLFEREGIKQTNESMAISFDFKKDIPKLEFELSHFKNYIEIWKRVIQTYVENQWSEEMLERLVGIFQDEYNSDVRDSKLKKWLQQYKEQRVWPDFELPVPSSKNPDLDESLTKVWRVWREVVTESSRYGKNRNMLENLLFSRRDSLSELEWTSSHIEEARWSIQVLAQIDSDNWAARLAKGAYSKAKGISKLKPNLKLIEIAKLQDELGKIFKAIPKREMEIETLARDLQEFLQLPIWRYRYELYSVWVVTQIVNAFKKYSIRVHQINNTLKFSFSGTHFATIDDFDPKLHICTELRSPLINPSGKKRTKSIQPDYSLVTDPITSPIETTMLVIECKQYRKPSLKNFSSALSDYARGRPNAHVILVNYGLVNQNILDKVDSTVRNRTSLIGMMRPGSIESLNEFENLVQKSLLDNFAYSKPESISDFFSKKGSVTLKWGQAIQDLDLHLKIKVDKDVCHHICFRDKGSIESKPWAMLEKDVVSANGTEVIEIAKWMEGEYHFAVKNFSSDAPLSKCCASIKISAGNQELQLQCPDSGKGRWWSVLMLNTRTNQFKVINRIVENLEQIT